ncbi:hypothetical protein D5396_04405 [Rahnella inusitata]|uniref:PheST operon leader peptide PheM n=1 Tax=Rahnella inusitata TaxID=58169 RepID=A0ABX9P881_9GAMM|nr:hypothetical protein D5396_04405 [Rahnella inusitata]
MHEDNASQRAKCEFFSIFFVILSLLVNLARRLFQAQSFTFLNSFPAELNKIKGFYTCNSASILNGSNTT